MTDDTRTMVCVIAAIIAVCVMWCHGCSTVMEDSNQKELLRQSGYHREYIPGVGGTWSKEESVDGK